MATAGHCGLGHPAIEGDGVVLRPTNVDDLDLLVRWFRRPDVAMYWGGRPLSVDEVAAKYLGQRRPAVECFVIQHDGSPVGWMQYHLDGERSGGIDMVLLEEHRRLGVGGAAVRAMVDYLLNRLHWSEVTVDPDDRNDDGKAFWEAVGFERFGLISDDGDRAPYVQMRLLASSLRNSLQRAVVAQSAINASNRLGHRMESFDEFDDVEHLRGPSAATRTVPLSWTAVHRAFAVVRPHSPKCVTKS